MLRSLGRAVVGAALLLPLISCGGGEQVAERAAEKRIEDAAGGDAKVDIEDGGVKVETTEGTVTLGQQLPEDFPEEVELVEGTVLMAAASEQDRGWFVTLTPEDPDRAFDDAVALLTDAGFTVDDEGSFGDTSTAQLSSEGWEVTVTTVAAGTLTYTVVGD